MHIRAYIKTTEWHHLDPILNVTGSFQMLWDKRNEDLGNDDDGDNDDGGGGGGDNEYDSDVRRKEWSTVFNW